MALKSLKITTQEAPTAKSSDVAIVEVDGSLVSRYNKAVTDFKDAEAVKTELGAKLKEVGLPLLFQACIDNPTNPPSSVKLRDEIGMTVRLTSQDKYSVVDDEAADPVFTALGIDINDFVQYTVQAKFNSGIFLDASGNFSVKVYNAFKKAIDQATAALVKAGDLPAESASPLATAKVATTKPDFHAKRWSAAPAVASQLALSAVVKNTVTLTPVVEGKGK